MFRRLVKTLLQVRLLQDRRLSAKASQLKNPIDQYPQECQQQCQQQCQ